jgi:hypothetical protein
MKVTDKDRSNSEPWAGTGSCVRTYRLRQFHAHARCLPAGHTLSVRFELRARRCEIVVPL